MRWISLLFELEFFNKPLVCLIWFFRVFFLCYDTNNFWYFQRKRGKKMSVNLQRTKKIFTYDIHSFMHCISLFTMLNRAVAASHSVPHIQKKTTMCMHNGTCTLASRFKVDVCSFFCVVCMWKIVMENCRDNYHIFLMYVHHVKFPVKKKQYKEQKKKNRRWKSFSCFPASTNSIEHYLCKWCNGSSRSSSSNKCQSKSVTEN